MGFPHFSKLLRIAALAIPVSICFVASAMDAIPIKGIHFEQLIGNREGDANDYSCVGGASPYLLYPTQKIDAFVDAWLRKNPLAMLVPVSDVPGLAAKGEKSRIVYVWIIDGARILNVDLVLYGVVPGVFMRDVVEVDRKAQLSMPEFPLTEPNARRFISDAKYSEFMNVVNAAEIEARKHKRGIWADKFAGRRKDAHLR